ncbi:hypothetical protein FACS189475_02200 [Betaproteobacteria bacterium]|nr:hypothetical protein FACS189475_02200 [Betaproteobacteria bacterium]
MTQNQQSPLLASSTPPLPLDYATVLIGIEAANKMIQVARYENDSLTPEPEELIRADYVLYGAETLLNVLSNKIKAELKANGAIDSDLLFPDPASMTNAKAETLCTQTKEASDLVNAVTGATSRKGGKK